MRPPLGLNPQLSAQLRKDLPQSYQQIPTGGWQTFQAVSTTIAAGAAASPLTVTVPVRAALFEISGAAYLTSAAMGATTASQGGLDAFTVQVQLQDGTSLNAGASQLIGQAFFNRLTGIKQYRKPWVIGANQTVTAQVTNISSTSSLIVAIAFTFLMLDLATNAQQF
jgi:hypothetical protein